MIPSLADIELTPVGTTTPLRKCWNSLRVKEMGERNLVANVAQVEGDILFGGLVWFFFFLFFFVFFIYLDIDSKQYQSMISLNCHVCQNK